MTIDWIAFCEVLLVSVVGASVVVVLYALGIRLLAVAGRTPYIAPLEFEEAITVVPPKLVKKEAKRVRKARKRNPYTPAQKRLAFAGACTAFGLCGAFVLFGLYLIVPYFHGA